MAPSQMKLDVDVYISQLLLHIKLPQNLVA